MALTVSQSGSQTPGVLGTEEILGTAITVVGAYALRVDTANLANGETVTLRAWTRPRSTDTLRKEYEAVYQHAQATPGKMSVPVACSDRLEFRITQSGGTLRAYPYAIVRLDA